MNASDDGFEWVNVSEASRRLGLSPSEVRRRIRVGTLRGERHQRGPGDTRDRFMVQLPILAYDGHEFVPLSGSQDAHGAYQRCGVDGCKGAPDGHAPGPLPYASANAQPRADSERLVRVIDALLHANSDTMERQAEEIASLREQRAMLQAERANALERAIKAEEELTHLRIDIRRKERLADEMELRATRQEEHADAQEARADELTEKLAAAEARASTAEAALRARRWRWWPW